MATKKGLQEYIGTNYKQSDDLIISLYLDTEKFYRRLKREIGKSDLLLEYTNKVGATNTIKNPLSIEFTKTVQTMNNLLKSMGLTPAQRRELTGGGLDGFEDV